MPSDRPLARLSRHFFAGMFDLGFLSETGTVSFTRLVIGVCVAFFSFGLLLTRVYAGKYVALSEMSGPERYRMAIVVDHAFLLTLPMWIVAFVTVLVAHSLFPDEIDFRVLTPLPVTRRFVFGSKLVSLLMFAGLFIGAMQAAIAPLGVVMTVSRWAEGLWVVRFVALVATSVLACVFCVLAVGALQGLLLLAAPRGRAGPVANAVKTVLLCALILCLPFIARLPSLSPHSLLDGAGWWSFVPPAWFAGLERWLLGDTRPAIVHLASIGMAALVIAAVVAIASYALLYLHFERLLVRAVDSHRPRRTRQIQTRPPRKPVVFAIQTFVVATLRRSALHQGVVVVIAAIGAGFAVNSFITHDLAGWMRAGGAPRAALVASVVWAPFAFMYVSARAVRLAFLLPLESRANWVFRMTERESSRADQLDATVHTLFTLGVIAPMFVLLPIQLRVIGTAAIPAALATGLFGYVYVELLMKDWARLPFTCSYIPGKRFVPQRILVGTAFFVTFTVVGTEIALRTMHGSVPWLTLDVALAAAAIALRRRRIDLSRITPLEFEDVMPTELVPLKLSQE